MGVALLRPVTMLVVPGAAPAWKFVMDISSTGPAPSGPSVDRLGDVAAGRQKSGNIQSIPGEAPLDKS